MSVERDWALIRVNNKQCIEIFEELENSNNER